MAPPGSIDRTPPPFFRQGTPARTRMAACVALALLLMLADTRWALTAPLRSAMATVLLPMQRLSLWPRDAWQGLTGYGAGLEAALADNEAMRQRLVALSEQEALSTRLLAENNELRALLSLRPLVPASSVPAEVLYETSDRYSRKSVIDRGSQQGVALGAPVIHEGGLLGQVTRVYPFTAEVTLLQDNSISVPVLNQRTRLRGVAFGDGNDSAGMELRFVAANADVQVGDELVTSGLDGVYPAGLAVARVASVQRQAESSFARIELSPAALADGRRHVLVLPLKAAATEPQRKEAP